MNVLEQANELIHGKRNEDYGPPLDDFARTAHMWESILGVRVTPEQVGLCMVCVKISRFCNAPNDDNLVDGAGYFGTIEMIKEERLKRIGADAPASKAAPEPN